MPVGALSGLAVIAVVVGVSTVSNGLFLGATPSPETAAQAPAGSPVLDAALGEAAGGASAGAQATPIAVGAGSVDWIDVAGDGSLGYNTADVSEVCPPDDAAGCATLSNEAADSSRLATVAQPKTIIADPGSTQAVVVSRTEDGTQELVVVDLPERQVAEVASSPEPTPASASETPTEAAVVTPDPSADATGDPFVSASDAPSSEPPASTEPTEAAASPDVEPSTAPTDAPPTDAPPTDIPTPSPEATLAASLSIASDIEVIGQTAAFSADGDWFAFTARPAGAATGSDVYLWRVGEADALPLTTDGESAFASWAGDQVVVSRPFEGDTSAESAPTTGTTVTVDPSTGVEAQTSTTWRPAVDPKAERAVAWIGTVTTDADGSWRPDEGRLELQTWPEAGTDRNSAQVVSDTALADFDVRWDETGEWFAVWTADAADATIGRLSLYRVDPETGELDVPTGAPIDVPAQPGFSIGDGRLAWATPPGQGGEGSRVQIAAWAGDGVGSIESAPGEMLVVIR